MQIYFLVCPDIFPRDRCRAGLIRKVGVDPIAILESILSSADPMTSSSISRVEAITIVIYYPESLCDIHKSRTVYARRNESYSRNRLDNHQRYSGTCHSTI